MAYDDARVVEFYDIDNPDGPDHDFYRGLADEIDARTIVDLGCGTGMLTVTLAVEGRRVIGVDPSPTMLAVAAKRAGGDRVEWVEGDSADLPYARFDLAVMTGNVAQHIPDGAWERTLGDLRARMEPGAVLSSETRDPAARAWLEWADEAPSMRHTPHGPIEESIDVDPTDGRIVRFHANNRFVDSGDTVTETITLVFRTRTEVEQSLRDAGFAVEGVYRDWHRTPHDASAKIMVFVARAV